MELAGGYVIQDRSKTISARWVFQHSNASTFHHPGSAIFYRFRSSTVAAAAPGCGGPIQARRKSVSCSYCLMRKNRLGVAGLTWFVMLKLPLLSNVLVRTGVQLVNAKAAFVELYST
jgi:hypothetical protein